jgi:hypothetical protein
MMRTRYARPHAGAGRGAILAAVATAIVLTGSAPADAVAGDKGDGPACTMRGTPGNDHLSGTPGRDVICGLGGDDQMFGHGGNDVFRGGPGDDRITDSAGADRIAAGAGDDFVFAGPGSDRLSGGAGADQLVAGTGADRVHGNRGRDRLSHGLDSVRDVLDGDAGPDLAHAARGDRVIQARRLRGTECSPSKHFPCVSVYNQSGSTATVSNVDSSCAGSGLITPADLGDGASQEWSCPIDDDESVSVDYTTGGSTNSVTIHDPQSGFYDPFLVCTLQGTSADTACIPIFTGHTQTPTGTLYFQPSGTSNPAGMGTGQGCKDPNDPNQGHFTVCTGIGSLQATNNGGVTFASTGQEAAHVYLQKPGSSDYYDSQEIAPGDTASFDNIDVGTAVHLDTDAPEGYPGSAIVVTQVYSYGHDGDG